MKLYNKIFSTFFIFSLFFCFSMEITELFPVKMVTHPEVSEPERFSDKHEIQILYCPDLPGFETHNLNEFMQFSCPIDYERRVAFDESFETDRKIRLISTETIINYVRTKEVERFKSFIETYGAIEDLLKDSTMISEAFSRTKRVYVKELQDIPPENPSDIEESGTTEELDPKRCYFRYEILSFDDHNKAFCELVEETSRTAFGRKSLTLFLLCHYCLGHPIFGKDLDLMIGVDDFTSAYPVIEADFYNANLEEYAQAGALIIDRDSRILEFIKGLWTQSYMFCHELNHATHLILGKCDAPFEVDKYLADSFLKELFAGRIEEIKQKMRERFMEKIQTRKDIESISSSFSYDILDELDKKLILKNKNLIREAFYNDIIKHYFSEGGNAEDAIRLAIMLIREYDVKNSFGEEFLEKLASKDFDEIKAKLKEAIFGSVDSEEGVDTIVRYRYSISSYFPSLYGFLDERILEAEEKDSICKALCDNVSNNIILYMFESFEEINNILGIELIDDTLFINEFSDIYQFLPEKNIFRFGYITDNRKVEEILGEDTPDWCKDLLFDLMKINIPTKRSLDILLQLHGFDKK